MSKIQKLQLALCSFMVSTHSSADISETNFLKSTTMAYEDCMEYSKNGWFALHRVNNKTRLSPVTIDSSHCPSTGNIIVKPEIENSIAYLKIENIKPSTINELNLKKLDPDEHIYTDTHTQAREYRFDFLDKKYSLTTKDDKIQIFLDKKPMLYIPNCTPSKTTSCDIDEDDYSTVMWIGDLNNDGYIDIIKNDGGSKSSVYCFYLSKKTSRGVKLNNTGCQSFSG
jgi:hypothetical protein